jgi:hypothetical protein
MGRFGSDDNDWKGFAPHKREPRLGGRRLTLQRKKRQREPGLFTNLKPRLDIRGETGASIKRKIKDLILANPDLTAREIKTRIRGVSLITVGAIACEFRADIKLLRERGYWRD